MDEEQVASAAGMEVTKAIRESKTLAEMQEELDLMRAIMLSEAEEKQKQFRREQEEKRQKRLQREAHEANGRILACLLPLEIFYHLIDYLIVPCKVCTDGDQAEEEASDTQVAPLLVAVAEGQQGPSIVPPTRCNHVTGEEFRCLVRMAMTCKSWKDRVGAWISEARPELQAWDCDHVPRRMHTKVHDMETSLGSRTLRFSATFYYDNLSFTWHAAPVTQTACFCYDHRWRFFCERLQYTRGSELRVRYAPYDHLMLTKDHVESRFLHWKSKIESKIKKEEMKPGAYACETMP